LGSVFLDGSTLDHKELPGFGEETRAGANGEDGLELPDREDGLEIASRIRLMKPVGVAGRSSYSWVAAILSLSNPLARQIIDSASISASETFSLVSRYILPNSTEEDEIIFWSTSELYTESVLSLDKCVIQKRHLLWEVRGSRSRSTGRGVPYLLVGRGVPWRLSRRTRFWRTSRMVTSCGRRGWGEIILSIFRKAPIKRGLFVTWCGDNGVINVIRREGENRHYVVLSAK